MTNLPLVIVLSGLPATGKTSLAGQIGRALGLPVWGKDAIKEGLWDALGADASLVTHRLGRVSVEMLFGAIETCLEAGCGCVVESTFRPALDAARFLDLQARYGCRLVSLHCVCDEAVRDARFRARVARGERHPCHPDKAVLERGADTSFSAPGVDEIGPLPFDRPPFVLDTTNFDTISVQALLARLAAQSLS